MSRYASPSVYLTWTLLKIFSHYFLKCPNILSAHFSPLWNSHNTYVDIFIMFSSFWDSLYFSLFFSFCFSERDRERERENALSFLRYHFFRNSLIFILAKVFSHNFFISSFPQPFKFLTILAILEYDYLNASWK